MLSHKQTETMMLHPCMVHAVGGPPSIFFSLNEAMYAARKDGSLGDAWLLPYVYATPERLRMLCTDKNCGPDSRAKTSC